MLKRHCDICDGVIGETEQYRTIHFGRGSNEDIDIGVDPQCICKKCWKTMITSVKPEAYIDNIDPLIRKKNSDNIVSTIAEAILPDGVFKRCKNCKHADDPSHGEHCKDCTNFSNWVSEDA